MKLLFISEYVIKIWFGIGASNQENHLQMLISQSHSMLWFHVFHFWKYFFANMESDFKRFNYNKI